MSSQPFLPFYRKVDGTPSHPLPSSASLPLTEIYCNQLSSFWEYCKSGTLPRRWSHSVNSQAPGELFLAPAHSQENTTYKTEHTMKKRNRITFQPATLPPFPRTQSKMQEETTVKLVYISLGFLQHVAKAD